jgi:hypothetical protein
MTTHDRDKVIAAAKEASFCEELWDVNGAIVWSAELNHMERFYAIAFEAGRVDEREDCALICDSHADDPVYCGEAIRVRSMK